MRPKIVMSMCCLLGTIFLWGMEPAHEIIPYFSQGNKDIRKIVARQMRDPKEGGRFLLPIGLASRALYKAFDNRFFIQDIIGIYASVTGQSRGAIAKALKTRRANNYIIFNDRMYINTISSCFDKKILKEFHFFVELGGDPHYSTPTFRKTFLMNAVRFNNPKFVEMLLELKVPIDARDYKGRSARHFNLICDIKELENSLYSIINYLCPLGMRCRLRPNEPFDMTPAPFAETEIQRLAKALYIDKILEDAGAAPIGTRNDCPLLMMLAARDGMIIREVLREIYRYRNENMKKGTPQWLYEILCVARPTLSCPLEYT
jgi:hypothetical protein